jgi:hypothetical protein
MWLQPRTVVNPSGRCHAFLAVHPPTVMSDFTSSYDESARLFRAYVGPSKAAVIPQPATHQEIEAAERALGARLPGSFQRFQLEFGDCQNSPIHIFTVRSTDPRALNIVAANLAERTVPGARLPAHLIAFSDDGSGDLFCFDTRAFSGTEAPVVVWDHELNEDQTPELVAADFADWLRSEIQERVTEDREFQHQWRHNVIGSFAWDLLRRFRTRGRSGSG